MAPLTSIPKRRVRGKGGGDPLPETSTDYNAPDLKNLNHLPKGSTGMTATITSDRHDDEFASYLELQRKERENCQHIPIGRKGPMLSTISDLTNPSFALDYSQGKDEIFFWRRTEDGGCIGPVTHYLGCPESGFSSILAFFQ